MKKFFSKKSEEEERTSMFGRKKPASPAPQDSNPYAQQPAADPYANSSVPNAIPPPRNGLPSGPRPGGLPGGPAPRTTYGTSPAVNGGSYGAPPPAYSGSPEPSSGYGNNKFGAPGGYGGSRYASGDSKASTSSSDSARGQIFSQRPGGYGGLASPEEEVHSVTSSATAAPGGSPSFSAPRQNTWDSASTAPPRYAAGDSHDCYGVPRERTVEEQQEDQAQATKGKVKYYQNETLGSTERSMANLENTLETANGVVFNIVGQGERLGRVNKNLDQSEMQNRLARDQTTQLNRVNRSILLPSGYSKKKQEAINEERLANEKREKEQREESRRAGYQDNQRAQAALSSFGKPLLGTSGKKKDYSDYGDYTFDDDDGTQAETERKINNNIDMMGTMMGRLHQTAVFIGEEVEAQNKQIDQITEKTDRVDDQVRRNRMKLDNIR
ncbi:hypothetical protein B0T22DRAFT_453268 [Podospora appendiculata]|uniref:t-SNARE coiled-coil homology domain-containing protein n=1 Tax=Podospora appendiculata TaxID=314037 RepID=A0AAE1CHW8_9PEZI|nr:hypothetical protein B0T22DRAFT_453268 [Podospora appendiculata]